MLPFFSYWPFNYEYPPESKIIKNMWSNLKPIELHKIKVVPFPENKYFQEEFQKTQIVLHHTISGNGVDGDISTWEADKDNVAVAIIVDREGIPWQLFSSRYWAYHLGAGNHDLDKHSIAIEIDNWGWLILGDGTVKQFNNPPISVQTIPGKYYTYYGNPVSVPMQEYSNGFRGYNYYEKYTTSQIQTVGELLLFWRNKYRIPLKYNEDMWNVSQNALSGISGVWAHVSYLPPPKKYDCHPQPDLIEMLKTLQTIL